MLTTSEAGVINFHMIHHHQLGAWPRMALMLAAKFSILYTQPRDTHMHRPMTRGAHAAAYLSIRITKYKPPCMQANQSQVGVLKYLIIHICK